MNPWQATKQLVWLLSPQGSTLNPLVWPGTTNHVLGRAGVVSAEPDWPNLDATRPFALVQPTEDKGLDEHPADLTDEVAWLVEVLAENANDQGGGAAVVGGVRRGAGLSAGRGVLELAPIVQAQLWAALASWGPRLRVSSTAPVLAGKPEMRGFLAVKALKVTATRLPALPAFSPVPALLATAPSSGHVALAWGAAPDRWDLVGVVVCRASGSTPPATPTSGPVTTLAATAVSYADVPGAGTWSYSLFYAYDSTRNPATGNRDPSQPVTDYSGSQAAGAAFAYAPATFTLTA